ncbi:hypothetical protein [Streptomyces sp. NPDC003710]
MTDLEDREQQAAVSRLLFHYLKAPIAEGCRLRGVLPALAGTRIYGSGDVSDAMGMTLVRLRPEEIPS